MNDLLFYLTILAILILILYWSGRKSIEAFYEVRELYKQKKEVYEELQKFIKGEQK